jgi:hypothetical protein
MDGQGLACDYQPNCPGKRVGAVLPAKLSPNATITKGSATMSLRTRLDRPEAQVPPSGEHRAVIEISERQDATVHVWRCLCGQPTCPQHPELTVVCRKDRTYAF